MKKKYVEEIKYDEGMTVRELRKALKGVPPHYKVKVPCREHGAVYDVVKFFKRMDDYENVYIGK